VCMSHSAADISDFPLPTSGSPSVAFGCSLPPATLLCDFELAPGPPPLLLLVQVIIRKSARAPVRQSQLTQPPSHRCQSVLSQKPTSPFPFSHHPPLSLQTVYRPPAATRCCALDETATFTTVLRSVASVKESVRRRKNPEVAISVTWARIDPLAPQARLPSHLFRLSFRSEASGPA